MARFTRAIAFTLVAVAVAIPAQAEKKPPNAALNDPRVVAVRSLYQTVEDEITAGRLKKEEQNVGGCNPWGEDRTIFSSADGTIRKYVWKAGTDDSLYTIRHYYDAAQQLRFVFVSAGAVNDTHAELRAYYDEQGKRIRDDWKITSGPGYPFASLADDSELIQRDPRRAFERVCNTYK